MALADQAAPATVSPSIAALLAAQPRWLISTSVETAFGYKDNLLLSYTRPEKSFFGQASVDAMLWRLPRGRTDFISSVTAEERFYFQGEEVDHETSALMLNEWRYRIPDTLSFSLGARGFHLDTVSDISDTDTRRVVAVLEGQGFAGGPKIRWDFLRSWWIEAEGEVGTARYRGGFLNNRSQRGAAWLGWHRGERFEIRVGGFEQKRDFPQRKQYTLGGQESDSETPLAITEREGAVRIDVGWDRSRRWSTSTTVSLIDYADNGTGYLNYRERKVAQKLVWKGERWTMEVEGSASRAEYEIQAIGAGVLPPPRIKEDFETEAKIERNLSEHWVLFLRYAWARTRSNDQLAAYRMNEGLLGLRWSWEK